MECQVCIKEDICGYGQKGCKGPANCRWCNVAYDAKCAICIKLYDLRMKMSAIRTEMANLVKEVSAASCPGAHCVGCWRLSTQIDALCDKIKADATFIHILRQRPIRKRQEVDLLTGTPVRELDIDKHKTD